MTLPSETADFESWYRAEHPRIVAALSVASGDLDVAREAAAEAFVRAYERWDRVGSMDRRGGWVHRTALNVMRRRYRRRSMERTLLRKGAQSEVLHPPEADIDLWRAVAKLPERTRTAVALRYVADLTEPEVAKAMGISRGTVATLLHRARAQLGISLAAPGGGATDDRPRRNHLETDDKEQTHVRC